MSLPHAILTALSEKPSSGLELARRFDRSIRYFWSATHQQIYRELNKLEEIGYISAREERETLQGQKKTYEVLPAGRAALAQWVRAGQDPRPMRDVMVLRMRAAAVVGIEGIEAELQRHLDVHRHQLSEYLDIEQRDFVDDSTNSQRLRHLVLRAGVGLETFWTEWFAEAIAAVQEMQEAETDIQQQPQVNTATIRCPNDSPTS